MSDRKTVEAVVKQVLKIENDAKDKADGGAKHIRDSCRQLANLEHNKMNIKVDPQTGELTSKPTVSHRYYTKLMADFRNGIKDLGIKNHAIKKNISSFIRKYGKGKPEIENMLSPALPIEKLRDNIILLRSEAITGSQFRKDVMSLRIEHHAYYMFEPKGAIKDWIRDDSKAKLKEKSINQILVNPDWIKTICEEILKDNKSTPESLAVAIIMSAGRRITEVLKTAKFKVDGEYSLLFSGQLKTKNRNLFEEIKPYKIPTLVKAELVAEALKSIRKATSKDLLNYHDVRGKKVECTVKDGDIKDYYHNRAVGSKYETPVNQAVRQILQSGHFSSKDCRALYTEITYDEHKNEGESRSAYRHRVLGHSLIETQLHYEVFQVDKSVKTIKVIKEEPTEESQQIKEALLEYLKKADADIEGYTRAPKMLLIHNWLKAEVENDLTLEEITAAYIRKHCLADGKQINLNTIKKYLNSDGSPAPSINIDKFEPPKAAPKNDNERKLQELQDQIQESKGVIDSLEYDKGEIESEKHRIEERLEEIPGEIESIEEELEDNNEQLQELRLELEELEIEIEAGADNSETEFDDDEPEWPPFNELKPTVKKQGSMWQAIVEVNGLEFECSAKGRKSDALEALRIQYNNETN